MKRDWDLIQLRLEELKSELIQFQVPRNLSSYLVVGEDHRFWFHFGVDPVCLVRAAFQSFKGSPQGGSTIAMQLVRTITGNYDRTLARKVKEICLAIKLTRSFKKQEIIKYYLAVAYFGWNMHGLEQVCRFLGKSCSDLSDYEAASVIARLKYPQSKYLNVRRDALIARRTRYLICRHKKLTVGSKYGAI